MLGVVTVDDVLELLLPTGWRARLRDDRGGGVTCQVAVPSRRLRAVPVGAVAAPRSVRRLVGPGHCPTCRETLGSGRVQPDEGRGPKWLATASPEGRLTESAAVLTAAITGAREAARHQEVTADWADGG